jgi:1D-myo-inositol-tetrakisphosphate 5-kinase/inositol-polyphosphate multikinase
VDDRGHFYKPLQRGPRGDRERAFYDAVAATLRAEEAAAAAAVAAAQERRAAERRTGRRASSPIAVRNGSASGAVAAEWATAAELGSSAASSTGGDAGGLGLAGEAPASPHAPLPWRRRQLLQTFPSYKEYRRERGPMHIMQRDELGLLSSRTVAQLGMSLPEDLQLHKQQRRRQQAGEPPLPSQASRFGPPHVLQEQPEAGQQQRRRPRSWSGSPPSTADALAQHAEQYGKSPDSDDCAEMTGRHLMQIVHPECPSSPSAADSPAAHKAEEQLQQGEQHSQQDQQQQQRGEAAEAGAAAPASPRLREHRHTTEHAEEAYTLPEHAQAAALLGQPVYDRSLNVSPVVVGGSGMPRPSPFSTSPQHSGHFGSLFSEQQQQAQQQAQQQQQQQQQQPGISLLVAGGRSTSLPLAVPASPRGAAAAAALADGLAQLSGLGSPAASVAGGSLAASCAAHWLQDEEAAADALRREVAAHGSSVFSSLPFSVRNAPLLRVIPKYYGVAQHCDGRTLLELEDLARAYHRPCIMDIKVGFRTWYPAADDAYIQRCKEKDESTTQAALGFKICGMQVFRHGAGGYWRASKRWCKTLPVELVDKALLSFAHNEHGLRPADVYVGGGGGAIAQLEALEAWFAVQRDFHFYSSSGGAGLWYRWCCPLLLLAPAVVPFAGLVLTANVDLSSNPHLQCCCCTRAAPPARRKQRCGLLWAAGLRSVSTFV